MQSTRTDRYLCALICTLLRPKELKFETALQPLLDELTEAERVFIQRALKKDLSS